MKRQDYFPVFSYQVARDLIDKGFKTEDVVINYKNPQFLVFYFINTDELLNTLKELGYRK